MNMLTSAQQSLSNLIDQLKKQKEELAAIYNSAINSGKKIDDVKAIYISLKDVDKRLDELKRISY